MANVIKLEDIIIIESSDWNMLLNGEKWVVFKDEICESLKLKKNYCYPYIETVYLQENETELLVGKATIYLVYSLLYNGSNEDPIDLAYIRNAALKEIYLEWCAKKSLKPNHKEGWFKSKKFFAYLDKIGWGGNYALFITDIVKYDTPRKIEVLQCDDSETLLKFCTSDDGEF